MQKCLLLTVAAFVDADVTVVLFFAEMMGYVVDFYFVCIRPKLSSFGAY